VLQVSDRVTILRDGEIVRTGGADRETPATLVEAMLGRALTISFPDKRYVDAAAPTVLSVRNLQDGGIVSGVTFDVRRGEIVGLGGLVGSGRSEVARLIFGAERPKSGSVEIDGNPARIASVRDAMNHGIAYLPESRKDLGLFLGLSVQENMTLAHLDEVTHLGLVSRRAERSETVGMLERLSVTPPNPRQSLGTLSGGNQQKVLFGKWLWQAPRLLIADEPSRGVDVGAKFAIYELLADLAARGMSILLISSEIEELIGLSHRVIVMARGTSVAELSSGEVTEDNVLHAAFRSSGQNTSPTV
jgi:ABC-type sugar transport system ATPase subunit